MRLSAQHGIEIAPFFIVRDPVVPDASVVDSSQPRIYKSVLSFIKDQLGSGSLSAGSLSAGSLSAGSLSPGSLSTEPFEQAAARLAGAEPQEVLEWGLRTFGEACGIAFSGAEDVALVHMATRVGLPFSVFCLDTGRLHPETYQFIDQVRQKLGVEIALFSPQAEALQAFVRTKGLFSFYEDGHKECCGIRKVEPLRRALSGRPAWVTGQRKDQSVTRLELAKVHVDENFQGSKGALVKLNPLADWSSARVWEYIKDHDLPYNALHDQGFWSIGCAPCTRPVRPGEHERAGRWWWEAETKRECGLHVK
jgi:phosphoadenosine phosphosulfate reductase